MGQVPSMSYHLCNMLALLNATVASRELTRQSSKKVAARCAFLPPGFLVEVHLGQFSGKKIVVLPFLGLVGKTEAHV